MVSWWRSFSFLLAADPVAWMLDRAGIAGGILGIVPSVRMLTAGRHPSVVP
jgi:hypothetical protein